MDLFSEREASSLMERLWQQVSAMLYLQVVSWSSIHWEVRTYVHRSVTVGEYTD